MFFLVVMRGGDVVLSTFQIWQQLDKSCEISIKFEYFNSLMLGECQIIHCKVLIVNVKHPLWMYSITICIIAIFQFCL